MNAAHRLLLFTFTSLVSLVFLLYFLTQLARYEEGGNWHIPYSPFLHNTGKELLQLDSNIGPGGLKGQKVIHHDISIVKESPSVIRREIPLGNQPPKLKRRRKPHSFIA